MPEGQPAGPEARIETFQSSSQSWQPLDLQPLWLCPGPDGGVCAALAHPWGAQHRPDWKARGLVIWPRGGQWLTLRLRLLRPPAWAGLDPSRARARLALRWWAEAAELRVDGEVMHRGDLFDSACRWPLPERWWQGVPLELTLRLRSPLHDDGALIHSRVELEPCDPADPLGLLAPALEALSALRDGRRQPAPGRVHVLGHAHLDLAWLWPVADTWRAAERTFSAVLALMERFAELHFGHSTPALYAWLEQHRPALFAAIRGAVASGRWEPLNGPWVESDCVLIGTASLLRQFQEGQHHSRRTFPEWEHNLAWLPDSFGFSAGLPAVATATGVRWFCTHKLAWNADNPFPHRLFRWRSRCGAELLALITAPIGTDGDPLAIERYRLEWQRATGVGDALWLPGVGDHGGGPTAEMLEQLALWQGHPAVAPQRHGSLRSYLAALEPLAGGLPVWRDELYLELHRGCATSRPDQKRHSRTLERLLLEAELARAVLSCGGPAEAGAAALPAQDPVDWRSLLFQQFHDILPGTSIPEVFEQAEPQWRAARRQACRQRDAALGACSAPDGPAAEAWRVAQLLPLPPQPRVVRLPAGQWSLAADPPIPLAAQPAAAGGLWLQLPGIDGVGCLELRRRRDPQGPPLHPAAPPLHPVVAAAGPGAGRWRLGNGLVTVLIGPAGIEQLLDREGRPQLAAPLAWRRWRDRGEFWDAWDLASDHRQHPLPWIWDPQPDWLERGPLAAAFRLQGRCGRSRVSLVGRLLAGQPWLELLLTVDWRQRHELLRLELPLAQPAVRWAADTPGGILERPAAARTARERSRWEVPALAWLASVQGDGPGGGVALLLDGPQGVDALPERLGVSLLRGPTWPDPGADNGLQRLRLALLPCPEGWRRAAVPVQARRFRAPLWCRPVTPPATAAAAPPPGWPALPPDLSLVSLRAAADGSGDVIVAVQNEGPLRRRFSGGPHWQLRQRLDGLDRPLACGDAAATEEPPGCSLGPWALGFWRFGPRRD